MTFPGSQTRCALIALAVCLLTLSNARAASYVETRLTSDVLLLESHGVDADEASIAQFLADGFPPEADLADGPKQPIERSQLLVAAMRVAAIRRQRKSVEALTGYLEAPISNGAKRLIDHDTERLPYGQGVRRRDIIATSLQANAVNALAYIGDKSGAPALARLLDAEKRAIVRVPIAIAAACCGERDAVALLVKYADDKDRRLSASAISALTLLTGEAFTESGAPVTMLSSYARRKQARDGVKRWWKKWRKLFEINAADVYDRRIVQAGRRPPIPPQTVYDWVLLAADLNNLHPEYGAFQARRAVIEMGESVTPLLETMILDEMEDIHLRVFAIRTYSLILRQTDPDRVIRALKKAAKDGDEEVSKLAKGLVEDLERSGRR